MTQDPYYPPGVTRPPAYDREDEPMCFDEDHCEECGFYLDVCICDEDDEDDDCPECGLPYDMCICDDDEDD